MITKKPFFSFIIPIYNTQEYIRRCVKSILSQTFTDYEIIIIDDGSNDGSGELCNRLAEEYNNIKVIHQDNAGPGFARNKGISEAIGEYIIFCDSDDFWGSDEAEFLHDVYRSIAENTNIDIVMFNGCYYYGDAVQEKENILSCMHELRDEYLSGADLLMDILTKKPEYQWYSVLYIIRRTILLENSIIFPNYMFCEDSATVYKIFIAAGPVSVFKRCVYYYSREREDSCTMNETPQVLKEIIDIAEKCICDVKGMDLNQELRKLLLNNFSTLYFMVMIRSSSLRRADLNEVIHYLHDKQYIMEYACSPKQTVTRSMVKAFGFRATIRLLGIRRFVKKRILKKRVV